MSVPQTTASTLLLALAFCLTAQADGVRDNDPTTVRQVPPAGVEVSAEWQEKIMPALDELAGEIVALGKGVNNFKLGDRVTVPFVGGCGKCPQCQE